jgi:predicted alpha/beta-hydrolase family hydrolase
LETAQETPDDRRPSQEAAQAKNPLRDERLLARCFELLGWAMEGRLRSFVIAGIQMDGTSIGGIFHCAGRPDRMRLLGELELMKTRIIDEIRGVNDGEV